MWPLLIYFIYKKEEKQRKYTSDAQDKWVFVAMNYISDNLNKNKRWHLISTVDRWTKICLLIYDFILTEYSLIFKLVSCKTIEDSICTNIDWKLMHNRK